MEYVQLNTRPRKINYCQRHTQYSTIHPDRVMQEHDMIFCTHGSWEIWQNGRKYLLTQGESLTLSAYEHHYGLLPSSPDCETIFVHFSVELEDCLLNENVNNPQPGTDFFVMPVLNKFTDTYKIQAMFDQVIDAYWSNKLYAAVQAEAYFQLLLSEITHASFGAHSVQAEKTDQIRKLLAILDRNNDRFYSNEELASAINVHPRTLNNYFLEVLGMPVHRYQVQRKLEMAHQMLQSDPMLTLSEIAERFGFCDEYHFSKHYKKKFGVSPKRHN